MASRDGVTFRRWLKPVIPEDAPEDRHGNRSNYMTWGLVELDDRPDHYSVYATEAYYAGPDSRLRRFEYRKDGFVSVRGGAKGGELITPPILLSDQAERLAVNFKTGDGGYIKVGLETADGQPIDGFKIEDGYALRGESLRENVGWEPTADISPLKGKAIRIRCELKNADLYSIQLQPWLK